MDLERFLTEAASGALQGVLAAAHARASSAGERTHLAHVLDLLLDEQTVRGKLHEEVRARARATLAEQIRALPRDASFRGSLAFDLDVIAGPALETSQSLGGSKVSALMFLAACLSASIELDPESERSREALRSAGVTAEMFLPGASERARRQDFTFRSPGIGIDGLGTDVTAMARAGFWPSCPLIGMEQELERLVVVLNSMRYSAAIVGEPGVGKSAFIAGFAWHLVHRTRPLIPPDMDSWTIVRIEASDILKGTSGRGELEGRVKDMLSFFMRNPTVIPFFEEVHKLLDTDDASSRSVATALKVPMAEERFRCVGVTTDREYARFIASDEAMNARFRKILLPEPSEEVACRIVSGVEKNLLRGKATDLGIGFAPDAIRTAVRVTSVYQRSDRLPRKAINLLGEAIAEKVVRFSRVDAPKAGDAEVMLITGDDVRRFFSSVTGVPVEDLNEDRSSYYHRLDQRLKDRVRGQDKAVEGVTKHLALYARGFVDQRRPRGRFLFLGPPGVGKTELASTLADEVLRDRGSVISVNMGDYRKEDALGKFMGASPGYVGFGQTPTLYSKVMMRPYSVVILDEFEKASPELANPMLAILDGSAEDSQGRFVDFSQCIFVLTSNAIMAAGDEISGASEDRMRARLLETGGIWTMPLVDRIDRVVLFDPIGTRVLYEILDRMIEARRKVATRALPPALDTQEARDAIVASASAGAAVPSARRLERSLLAWLSDSASL